MTTAAEFVIESYRPALALGGMALGHPGRFAFPPYELRGLGAILKPRLSALRACCRLRSTGIPETRLPACHSRESGNDGVD